MKKRSLSLYTKDILDSIEKIERKMGRGVQTSKRHGIDITKGNKSQDPNEILIAAKKD
ncbi:MAG: hypothetical protein JSV88_00990 [Candidatus Aminicenantes bacterium]|nr:MAG: hypothetical protein JSV88_00990 [Candidatus Aminicenantes bacterium]